MPPWTIAPRRPLPIGSASTHCRAGCAYQSTGSGEAAAAGDDRTTTARASAQALDRMEHKACGGLGFIEVDPAVRGGVKPESYRAGARKEITPDRVLCGLRLKRSLPRELPSSPRRVGILTGLVPAHLARGVDSALDDQERPGT